MMGFWRRRQSPATPAPAGRIGPAVVPMTPGLGMPLRDAAMRGWFQVEKSELFEGFRVGPEDLVADIGCGLGGHAAFCAQQGANLILTDIDPADAANVAAKCLAAPGHGTVEYHVSDSDPLPIADGVCTKIVCSEVIEHVDDPERLLAELVRIGKPGAQYLLTCPDPGSEAIQKRTASAAYFQKPFHLRILSHDDFAGLVERAGLIIERRTGYGAYWNLWLALFCACDVGMEKPDHPLLESWNATWTQLLDLPKGNQIKQALDDIMPRSQLILARKPA